MLCVRAAAAPIILRGVAGGSLPFFSAHAAPQAIGGLRLFALRFASSASSADVRDVLFCPATKQTSFEPLQDTIPDMRLGDAVSSSGTHVMRGLKRSGFKDTASLYVLRSVACSSPTALEERDGVDWHEHLTLHEVLTKHAISPNKNGEVFVLAGPEKIGNRAVICGFCFVS